MANSNTLSTLSPTSAPKEQKLTPAQINAQQIGAGDEAERRLGDIEDTPTTDAADAFVRGLAVNSSESFSTDGFMSLDQMFGPKSEQFQPTALELDDYKSMDPTVDSKATKGMFSAGGDRTLVNFNDKADYMAKQILIEMKSQTETTYIAEQGQIESRSLDLVADAPRMIDGTGMVESGMKIGTKTLSLAEAMTDKMKATVDALQLKESFQVVFGDLLWKQVMGQGKKKELTPEQMEKNNNKQISINADVEDKARVDAQERMNAAKEIVRIVGGRPSDDEIRELLGLSSGVDVSNLTPRQMIELRNALVDQQKKQEEAQNDNSKIAQGKAGTGINNANGRTDLKEGQSVTGSSTNGGQG